MTNSIFARIFALVEGCRTGFYSKLVASREVFGPSGVIFVVAARVHPSSGHFCPVLELWRAKS
jgi:hypothetical protein